MQKKTKDTTGTQTSFTGDQNTLKSMWRKNLMLKIFIGKKFTYLPIFDTLHWNDHSTTVNNTKNWNSSAGNINSKVSKLKHFFTILLIRLKCTNSKWYDPGMIL